MITYLCTHAHLLFNAAPHLHLPSEPKIKPKIHPTQSSPMNCSMTKFAIAATLLAVSLVAPAARAQHGGPSSAPMQPLPVAEKPAPVS